MTHTKPTLLIVDDILANIQFLGNFLCDDYDIVMATNGAKALELIASHHPDLILLDVMMPQMDGYEVCQRLKQDPATYEIPIIFISAKDETNDQLIGYELGAVDYITKPFEPLIVKAKIKTHIKLHTQEIELRQLNHTLEDRIAQEVEKRLEQERLVSIDPMTGLHNRRYFTHDIKDLYKKTSRLTSYIGFFLIDIDNFKLYNDTYGHQAGDRAIMSVAHCLKTCLKRETDAICRLGGEEFCAVIIAKEPKDIAALCDRIRLELQNKAIEHKNNHPYDVLTISGGLKISPSSPALSAKAMYKEADQLLYKAKQSGKNRIITSTNYNFSA